MKYISFIKSPKMHKTVRQYMIYILGCVVIYFMYHSIRSYMYINEPFGNEYKGVGKPPFPIDVVYTWAGEKQSTTDTRQADHNELRYSLRSVNMFMPWVNHVYILMNPPSKIPSWMHRSKHITIIDHNDVFSSDTPTTNSNAIETHLHKIRGLSEHFVYFNDDFFVGRDIPYTEFFTDDGKAVVPIGTNIIGDLSMIDKSSMITFEIPPSPAKWYPHTPIPRIKSMTEQFQSKYPEYITWVRKTSTRIGGGCNVCEVNNLTCPCQQQHYPLAYYMYSRQQTVFATEPHDYPFIKLDSLLKNGSGELDNLFSTRPKFFCLADFGALSVDDRDKIRNMINEFAAQYFSIIPIFEKN